MSLLSAFLMWCPRRSCRSPRQSQSQAARSASSGTVVDPAGVAVAGATVELRAGTRVAATVSHDARRRVPLRRSVRRQLLRGPRHQPRIPSRRERATVDRDGTTPLAAAAGCCDRRQRRRRVASRVEARIGRCQERCESDRGRPAGRPRRLRRCRRPAAAGRGATVLSASIGASASRLRSSIPSPTTAIEENTFRRVDRRSALHVLHRRRHRVVRQRAALPERGPAAAGRRRSRRGADQLLPLRLRRTAQGDAPFVDHHRTRGVPVEPRHKLALDRPAGAADDAKTDAAAQSRVPARRLRAR